MIAFSFEVETCNFCKEDVWKSGDIFCESCKQYICEDCADILDDGVTCPICGLPVITGEHSKFG